MTANHPFDDDSPPRHYPERRADPDRADREISLGTPTILGIFFALALVCAGFFGFGYSMGRKAEQAVPSAAIPSAPLTAANGSVKPDAGSPAAQAEDASATPTDTASAPTSTSAPQPASSTTPTPAANPADGMIVGDKPPASAAQSAAAGQQPASYVVQIAAVSSQDVADILLSSLQKKGYTVAVRHEPQDQLLHVQIGPFANRKDADAMRERVIADGFNAIVK